MNIYPQCYDLHILLFFVYVGGISSSVINEYGTGDEPPTTAILHNISKDMHQPDVAFNVEEDRVLHIYLGQ